MEHTLFHVLLIFNAFCMAMENPVRTLIKIDNRDRKNTRKHFLVFLTEDFVDVNEAGAFYNN